MNYQDWINKFHIIPGKMLDKWLICVSGIVRYNTGISYLEQMVLSTIIPLKGKNFAI